MLQIHPNGRMDGRRLAERIEEFCRGHQHVSI
jgi:hypothetical protein